MSTLELKSVSRYFGAYAAIEDFSLTIHAGGRAAIVGPSGSGKTTLLRLIAGFEVPDHGSISLGETTLADDTTFIPAHRRLIGYVPQDGALFPHMSVADNIGFGLPKKMEARARRIDELLDMVSLPRNMAQRWPHELSGGQQQRVALARALAQSPRLMLLDEPFSALDSGLRASMRKAVSRVLEDAGVTAILVTHDQEEALSFGEHLAVIRQGRLVQAGAPKDLYFRPVDEDTAAFLGDALVFPAYINDGWARCPLGNVMVDDAGASGHAQILLRPEQIHLSHSEMIRQPADGCYGTVLGSDFGGDKCSVLVRLEAADASADSPELAIHVRVPAMHCPGIGDRVHLFVSGGAHLFPASGLDWRAQARGR
ncbi:ABC transporter ATP-binding protein [Pseudomonas sp. ZM23]|uniref:ABC transporter ATP-binding protein n=1 Tax=Pseudomonas triclosanedens TaxID=2961893 RepID=A0ABY6ZQL9_9PSED|nr:ABC transporter ATP-binding protein [Pseudomonas triclosanedens]MCP8467655.1 ABC transporter ATP-binding protein [Pseudomonas triclosanedens]MCP8473401.1 ABC transporter ATP-binding protein [Pseudomonas triclosanedens]WAI47123.1 ABC transporter ATP-binding protein [Pseudomonas triclosanedens]